MPNDGRVLARLRPRPGDVAAARRIRDLPRFPAPPLDRSLEPDDALEP